MKLCSTSGLVCLSLVFTAGIGCGKPAPATDASPPSARALVPIFHVDPATAGSVRGVIRYTGPPPPARSIDMSGDPACVQAYNGRAHDESIIVGAHGRLANAFVYVEKGLEGKRFEVPATPVIFDQKGCWFRPRIIGIQTNQTFQIVNSDPVTHNIHPMAMINREWNHSQGPGDSPVERHFVKSEVMIPVKCNIHAWMHAYIGVVDHPYFAVSKEDGSFEIPNLPPGNYLLKIWHEKLGTQELPVTVTTGNVADLDFVYRKE